MTDAVLIGPAHPVTMRPVETTTLPSLPDPVEIRPGRVGWPDVFLYEWLANGHLYRMALPPPFMPRDVQLAVFVAERSTGDRMPHPDVQPRSWPYSLIVRPGQLAVFEALSRSGALRDVRHTGAAGTAMNDQRKAPEA